MSKILKYYSLLIFLVAIAIISAVVVSFNPHPGCGTLLGMNIAFIGIVQYCFLYPLICVVASYYLFVIGMYSLKSNRFPPAKVPGIKWLGFIKGWYAKAISVVFLLTPALSFWLIWAGLTIFTTILGGRSVSAFIAAMEVQCKLA